MLLAKCFLNLSMKEQICITIIALTLFCICVILIVCCSLIYEILNKDYEQKKLYFYKRYKEYIESTFYLQSFYMMQYEEIIHRIQKQTTRIRQSLVIYENHHPFQDYSNKIINMANKTKYNFTDLVLNNQKNNPYFYIISYSTNSIILYYIQLFTLKNYEIFANSFFTHDIYDHFRIPGYNIPIITEPFFYNIFFQTLFSFNLNKTNEKLNEVEEIRSAKGTTKKYFDVLEYEVELFFEKIESYMGYISSRLEIFSQMFEIFFKEIMSDSPNIFESRQTIKENTPTFGSYLFGIDYGNDHISFKNTLKDTPNNSYKVEMNTIKDLLFFLNNNFVYLFDIDFLPLDFQSNKIISKELCSLFKAKQKYLSGNEFNYQEIYNDIIKLSSDIYNCFVDKELIDEQEEIKDIFTQNFEGFMDDSNLIYQGILDIIPNTDEFPFYFMKYSYPNYNSLREFQSEYLFSDQINFYLFTSFKIAQKYVDHVYQISLNIFYFIVMVIIYSWLICLFINLIIFFKVIKEWTEPITKLQEAVESSNIKDDSIFNYKYDDIINELFLTCKELLTGQIDNNNENGLKNFNILQNNKDKKIDKNIYKKNLIINNEIMEELINKQQSMLDFSNNVKVNEPNNMKSMLTKKETAKSIKRNFLSIENLNKNTDSNKKENQNNLKNEREKENEPYIKLFKIAEYLNYYRSKLETNNIIIINNDNFEETKMSKNISKNTKSINSSFSNQFKNKNEEQNDNNFINMLDEKNITYLWYMEAKKRYRNFNYNVSDDYKELFSEFNDNYNFNQRIEQKKSFHMHKKNY